MPSDWKTLRPTEPTTRPTAPPLPPQKTELTSLADSIPKSPFDAKVRLVIYDFDGTLADLEVDWTNLITQVWEDFLVPAGIDRTDELVYHVMERNREQLGPIFDQLCQLFASVEMAAPYEPHKEVIAEMRQAWNAGVRVAIFSSNSRNVLSRFLGENSLEGKVVPVVAFEDVDRHKPHPEGLRLILDHHGLLSQPELALFIGDSSHDEEAAKAMGVPFRQVGERKY